MITKIISHLIYNSMNRILINNRSCKSFIKLARLVSDSQNVTTCCFSLVVNLICLGLDGRSDKTSNSIGLCDWHLKNIDIKI